MAITREGFCNQCGLCELGSVDNGLVIWDPTKKPGEPNAAYHRLVADLKNGRPFDEVEAEWKKLAPNINIAGYLSFPEKPEHVIEGCSYSFRDSNGNLIPVKKSVGGKWNSLEYDPDESIILNNNFYGG